MWWYSMFFKLISYLYIHKRLKKICKKQTNKQKNVKEKPKIEKPEYICIKEIKSNSLGIFYGLILRNIT